MDEIQVNIMKPLTKGEPVVTGQDKKKSKKLLFQQRQEKKAMNKSKFKKDQHYDNLEGDYQYQGQYGYNNYDMPNQPGYEEEEQIGQEQGYEIYNEQQATQSFSENTHNQIESIKYQGRNKVPQQTNRKEPIVSIPQLVINDDGVELFTQEKFSELDYIHSTVKRALTEASYDNMTKIQQLSIPPVYEKKNVIIKSETGSGKTMAYLVPLISQLAQTDPRINRDLGTFIFVICPTRELALQCVDAALKCAKRSPNIVIGALVGGENANHEKSRLRKGVTILFCTPGRLLYHLQNSSSFKYGLMNTIVFEECDRLLDLGFKKDVDDILQIIEQQIDLEKCQKILVSAHVNQNICQFEALKISPTNYTLIGFTSEFKLETQRQYRQSVKQNDQEACVWLGPGDEKWEIPKTLSQYYSLVEESQKLSFLFAYVTSYVGQKIIIFVATCDEVELLSFLFENTKHYNAGESIKLINQDVYKLHGNIEQSVRSKTYFSFKSSTNTSGSILFSTQVASRGLDFPDVVNILIFDPPDSYDDYINKVGRTARINKQGMSSLVLFNNNESMKFIKDIKSHLQTEFKPIETQNYFKTFQKVLFEKTKIHDEKPDQFLSQTIRLTLKQDRGTQLMSRRGYISLIRAYGRLKIFNIKTINLHKLAKAFGLDKSSSNDAKNWRYQEDLYKFNREKFRDQEIEGFQEDGVKKRKVVTARELSKMEFI